MATFSSKPATVNRSAAEICEKFSDLSTLQDALDNMPADQRAKVGDVALTKDALTIQTAQVGQISFVVVERSAERITLEAQGAPVPMKLAINIKAQSDNACEVTTEMDVNIPPFLKSMVGGALQKAVDQFGNLMVKLA